MRYKSCVEYRILGPLEVIDNGRELMLGPAKERAILGLLLLHAVAGAEDALRER
jgi:DNA-binding SARP family transcriptional activator